MGQQKPGLKFILLSPNEEIQKYSLQLLKKSPAATFDFEANIGYAISHLSRCFRLLMVASGTASLECALVGIPQVVVYKVHPLTFAVWDGGCVKVKHLQYDVNPSGQRGSRARIASGKIPARGGGASKPQARPMLSHKDRRERMKVAGCPGCGYARRPRGQ